MEDYTLRLTNIICKKLKYDPISIDLLFKGYRAKICITQDKDKVVTEVRKRLDKLHCEFVKIKVKKLFWKKKWIISILIPFNRKKKYRGYI
jgi:hypothetical protein